MKRPRRAGNAVDGGAVDEGTQVMDDNEHVVPNYKHMDVYKTEFSYLAFLHDFLNDDLEFTQLVAFLRVLTPLAELIRECEGVWGHIPHDIIPRLHTLYTDAKGVVDRCTMSF